MRISARLTCFLAAVAFLTAVLASCNVPEAVPAATPTPEMTATPIPPTATATARPMPTATAVPAYLTMDQSELEGVTVVLRYSLDGEARDRLEELTARFNEENSVGITLIPEPAVSMDSFRSAAGSSSGCEILIAGSAYLRNLSQNGPDLLDLAGFSEVPELALDGENIEPIMPVMLNQENPDGGLFAVPLWAEPAFLFYNKTWAQELGYPDTPEDLAAFAEQACAAGRSNYTEKDTGKHGTGGWIVSSDTEDVLSWMLAFASDGQTPSDLMSDPEGSVFADSAAWLRNLFDNGCAWNSRVREPYDYFANRYALFYSGTYSDAERQFNAFGQSESYGFDNWDLIPYPVRTGTPKNDPHIYGEMTSAAILKGNDAEMAAAWQFIRWLFTDTNAAELALAARAWPVQDNADITRLYRNSGEDKLYQTLSWRQYLVPDQTEENWLTDRMILADGFAYVFNPSASPEDIPGIWEQIGAAIAEINSVTVVSVSDMPETGMAENSMDTISETGGTYEYEP